MAFSKPVGRVLRASVARPELGLPFADALSTLPPAASGELASAAVFHGIVGYVRHAARSCAAPPATLVRLDEAVERSVVHHLRVLADLAHLATALDRTVPWLVVKGPVLAETVHRRPEFRTYADLDVLVPPRRFADALAALEAGGSRVLDRNWTLIRRTMKGQVHVRMPLGTAVDLHWSLLNDREVRDRYTVPTEDLFARSRTVTVGPTSVRTLGEADTIVHLALHTMLSGAHRLLWLKDLEQALEHLGTPAAAVRATARAWAAQLPLAAALARTRAAIGCPLRPRPPSWRDPTARLWLRLSGAVWRRIPVESEDGHGSLARMTARSVRPSGPASTGALAVKMGAYAVTRRGRRARGRLDPASPGSDRYDAGGAAEREAFLDAVARQPG